MGNTGSAQSPDVPTQMEFARIARRTYFSAEEVERLYIPYMKISNSIAENGGIDPHELKEALGINSEGIARRIFAAFENDGNGSLDFEEYIRGVSALSSRAAIDVKARFCFKVFDIDHNGFITRDELTEILSLSYRDNPHVQIPEPAMKKVISATFQMIDVDENGNITLDELISAASKKPGILGCIDLDLDQLLNNE